MNRNEGYYGKAPISLGTLDLHVPEHMYYLYLPVRMPYSEFRLPDRLKFVMPILYQVKYDIDSYVYLTVKRGYAVPDNPLSRPGWHTDGFETDDINYLWYDSFPTLFAVQEFEGIVQDHKTSYRQFTDQIDPLSITEYPVKTLLMLDDSVVHQSPVGAQGERQFIKVSVSTHKYNLEGNSHNYLFDYSWAMKSRQEQRNHPIAGESDYAV